MIYADFKGVIMKKILVLLCIFLCVTVPVFASVYDDLGKNIAQGNIAAVKKDIARINREKGSIDTQHFGDYGAPALVWAVEHEKLPIIKLLLDAGANVNVVYGPKDETALMMAASKGNNEIVKFLIRQGAAVNAMGYRGYTALMHASHEGHIEVIKTLIASGADSNAQMPEYVEIEAGKRTALLDAIGSEKENVVKFLLNNNADIHRHIYGSTAFEIAKDTNNTALIHILTSYRNAKLDDKAYLMSELTIDKAVDDVHIEKRSTGAFSKPHANEELIIFDMKNTSIAGQKKKIAAVFDVKNAKIITKIELIADFVEFQIVHSKNNTNILLATSYTKEEDKKKYFLQAFRVQNDKFIPVDVFTKIQQKLSNDSDYLYKFSENNFDIFEVKYTNGIKTLHHLLTSKWDAQSNSFIDIAQTKSSLYRFSENYPMKYSTWLQKGHWDTFLSLSDEKQENLRATLKKQGLDLAPNNFSSFELIEKDNDTSIIAKISKLANADELERQKTEDIYVPSTAYAIQTYLISEKNGLEILSVGEPLAVQYTEANTFSQNDRKKMGVFLSNFTEIGVNNFSVKELIASKDITALLNFGIYHNYVNNFTKRIVKCQKDCPHGGFKIPAKYVQESLKKYLDYDLTSFSSTAQFHYDGTYYHFAAKKENPVLYVRIEKATERPDRSIKMEGVVYNSKKKNEVHGRIEGIAKAHLWQGKRTFAIITLSPIKAE